MAQSPVYCEVSYNLNPLSNFYCLLSTVYQILSFLWVMAFKIFNEKVYFPYHFGLFDNNIVFVVEPVYTSDYTLAESLLKRL